MKKFPLLLLLLLLPLPAHATRCWVTLAKIGNGDVEHKNAKRPALGLMKKKFRALTVGQEGEKEELVLIIIDPADVSDLKKVAARYHGVETLKDDGKGGKKRVLTTNLRKKLLKEAQRLGADETWDPEKRDVAGE